MSDSFVNYFREKAIRFNIELSDNQIKKFLLYMELLAEYNNCVNLTAITDGEEIILKHFLDSLTVLPLIDNDKTVVDVGTGAGFPGVPLIIVNESIKMSLLESQKKRVVFLENLVAALGLKNVRHINLRAEDAGASLLYREAFDYAVSRAVAPLSVLCEYCLPLVKTGGTFLALKGKEALNEINDANNALLMLGGSVKELKSFLLDSEGHERTIIIIEKIRSTPEKFPRRPGIPSKKPL